MRNETVLLTPTAFLMRHWHDFMMGCNFTGGRKMRETYKTSEKLLITLAWAFIAAAYSIGWFMPGEWLYGCSYAAITGVLIGMTLLYAGGVYALWFIGYLVRCAREYLREREKTEQLIGNHCYISRETVCRTAGKFGGER
jgi:hypothetical protein